MEITREMVAIAAATVDGFAGEMPDRIRKMDAWFRAEVAAVSITVDWPADEVRLFRAARAGECWRFASPAAVGMPYGV